MDFSVCNYLVKAALGANVWVSVYQSRRGSRLVRTRSPSQRPIRAGPVSCVSPPPQATSCRPALLSRGAVGGRRRSPALHIGAAGKNL